MAIIIISIIIIMINVITSLATSVLARTPCSTEMRSFLAAMVALSWVTFCVTRARMGTRGTSSMQAM